jgi:hypothetical protein
VLLDGARPRSGLATPAALLGLAAVLGWNVWTLARFFRAKAAAKGAPPRRSEAGGRLLVEGLVGGGPSVVRLLAGAARRLAAASPSCALTLSGSNLRGGW